MTRPDPARDHARFLHAQPMFRRVSTRSHAFQRFLTRIRLERFERGRAVYTSGADSEHLYVVRDGEVHIRRTPPGEAPRVIGIHGSGSLFGEVSLLTGEAHSSDAVAALDSSVYCIPGAAFQELMELEPGLAAALAETLSKRLRRSLNSAGDESPARLFALFHPADPTRGAELSRSLMEAIAHENPGPALLFSLNEFAAHSAPADDILAQIFARWPGINIWEMVRLMGWQDQPYDALYGGAIFRPQGAVGRAEGLPGVEALVKLTPDLLGRLRKYYAVILFDCGRRTDHPITQRIVSQCDEILVVRSGAAGDRNGAGGARFRDAVRELRASATEFEQRSVLITEGESGLALPDEGVWARRALLSDPQIRSRNASPARSPDRRLQRLARRLSGAARGLCLGGGGARALAHIGVLQVFEEAGLDFDAAAGASMGAVIAAAYAMELDATEIARLVAAVIPDSDAILDKALPLVSFFRGRKLSRAILRGFGDLRFEDLEVPLYINSSDLDTGQVIVFDRGYVATALRASVTLPGVFPPVRLGPYNLVDGGVLNNLPGAPLRKCGMRRVLGVNVTPLEDRRAAAVDIQARSGGVLARLKDYLSLPPILKIVSRAIAIQGQELLRFRMEDFDSIIHPAVQGFDIFDFHRRDEIIAAGRRAAEEQLDEIKDALLPGIHRPV